MENNSPLPTSPVSQPAFPADAFRPGPSALGLLGMLALALFTVVIGATAYAAAHHGNISALLHMSIRFQAILQLAIDAIVAIYLAALVPALSRTSLRALGFRAPLLRDIGIALAGAIAMILVVNVTGSAIMAAAHTKQQEAAVRLFLQIKDPTTRSIFIVLGVAIGPMAEEFAFRIFIFNALRRYWGFWAGAIVSGLFFGAAHLDVYALVPLALGGVILAYVYARTRNAWMPMLTHACFNGVSFIALYAAPHQIK